MQALSLGCVWFDLVRFGYPQTPNPSFQKLKMRWVVHGPYLRALKTEVFYTLFCSIERKIEISSWWDIGHIQERPKRGYPMPCFARRKEKARWVLQWRDSRHHQGPAGGSAPECPRQGRRPADEPPVLPGTWDVEKNLIMNKFSKLFL